jgi:hypothetical protein
MRWFMVVAWSVIAAKCGLIWWAMVRWHVPFHPMWIIGPTVAFAVLASALWLTDHPE